MNNETMMTEAKRNFLKSIEFDKKELDTIRNDFYFKFAFSARKNIRK
jgi:hypothetical protein